MEALSFAWYWYLFVFLIISASVTIGIYFGCLRKQKTKNDYLLGSRNMKPLPAAISLVASVSSTDLLIGLTSDVYLYGASFLLESFCLVIVFLVTVYVYMPVFLKLKINTTYEYLEMRFDRRMRLFASFTFCIFCILYLPVIIYAPSLVLSAATGVKTHILAVIVSSVVILYTSMGGLRTVIWTDTFQFLIVYSTFAIVLVLGVVTSGGLSKIWSKALDSHRLDIFEFDPDPTRRDSFWIILIGVTLSTMSYTTVDQAMMQKFLSVPTFRDSVLVLLYFCVGVATFHFIVIFLGLILYTKYGDCDPFGTGAIEKNDQLMILMVQDIAQKFPGITNIFIIAIFCSSMSTQSAYINCVAGTVCEDFLPKVFTERKLAIILRLAVVAVGAVSTSLIFLVENLGEIFPLFDSAVGVTVGPILGVFTMGILSPRANSTGAFYGTLCGIFTTLSIVAPATYYKMQGLFFYPMKTLSTEGCLPTNQTFFRNSSAHHEIPFLFKISFFYYTAIGVTVTVIAGLIISYLTKKEQVDRKLISPICHFLLSDQNDEGDQLQNLTTVVDEQI